MKDCWKAENCKGRCPKNVICPWAEEAERARENFQFEYWSSEQNRFEDPEGYERFCEQNKKEPVYVIFAQMGNKEDWGWEEVNRTSSIDEAREAYRKGARVYEDFGDNDFNVECIFDVTPEDDSFELPF